jgi:hypothetical protein
MNIITPVQLNAIMSAALLIGSGAPTNLQAGRMGINVGKQTSSAYSRQYIDWTRRIGGQGKFLVPATSTPVALDGSGNPTASYEYILTASALTNDLGVYNCWMPGQCASVQASSFTTAGVSFSSPVYTSGDNKTRWTMTVTSGGGALGVRINTPAAGAGYPRILPALINGVAVIEAQSDAIHPDSITQMSVATTIRGLDWIAMDPTETDWVGSTAAGGDGSIHAASQSLAEFIRYCNACSASPWVNVPPLATDDYLSHFISTADSLTTSTANVTVEAGGDEPWNNQLQVGGITYFDMCTQSACAMAFTYAGARSTFPIGTYPTATCTIVSCSRTSNIATAIITGPPKNGNGSHAYVAGITNITGGYVTLTGVVNNGDGTYSISWPETGADVTGTVNAGAHTYASYIHTDVEATPHYLVKGSTAYGVQTANNYATPNVMKGRYVVERTRVAWTAAQALSGKARFRFVINNQFGGGTGNGLGENEVYPYALERWGDHSWIYSVVSAPYMSSETASQASATAADVLYALEHTGNLALDALQQGLIREGNLAAAWDHAKAYYEGGPGNTNVGSAGAAIGAAHRDPGMKTLMLRHLQMLRDSGHTGPYCHYEGGAVATFGSGNNTCWALHEGGAVADLTTPKAAALVQWGASSSVAAPIDGWTSGAINVFDAISAYYGTSTKTNGCLIAGPTAAIVPYAIQVSKSIAGNYPISVYDCSTSSLDWVTIEINGVVVANQIPLTVQNPTIAAPATPVWSSAAYPMNAGRNVVKVTIKPTGRVGTVGLYQVVSPDTPV